jgi:hypothetical protein
MRVVVDETLVQKRASAARNAMTISVALLLVAAALSFNPRYILPAYGCLMVSLPLVVWGSSRALKYVREPRPDQVVAKALKGLDHAYRLYSFKFPAEQVLLCPNGLFALQLRMVDGKISCRGTKWQRKFVWSRIFRLLTDEWLGNPGSQAQTEADKLRRFLTERAPDLDIQVQPLAVFLHPNVELRLDNPAVLAVTVRDLKAHLRDARPALPQDTYTALTRLFDERSA